jgi:hypothetical protein
MKELKERIENVEGLVEESVEKIKNLEENIGMIDVYKEIIKNSEEARTTSLETYKFFKIIIVTLSILIVILAATIFINQKEFTQYRENSVNKNEIIEILNSKE